MKSPTNVPNVNAVGLIAQSSLEANKFSSHNFISLPTGCHNIINFELRCISSFATGRKATNFGDVDVWHLMLDHTSEMECQSLGLTVLLASLF